MGILFIIALALLLIAVAPKLEGSEYTGKNKRTFCPLHEWYWDENGKLRCTRCGNPPGYTSRDDA